MYISIKILAVSVNKFEFIAAIKFKEAIQNVVEQFHIKASDKENLIYSSKLKMN